MRYIGNKAKLLPELEKMLSEKDLLVDGLTFCDLFSGTCTVGDYFKNRYKIIANDTLYMSYCISSGKLNENNGYFKKLGFDPFDYFNRSDYTNYKSGFCYNTFAPTKTGRQYFSDENAKKIDFIRDTIDEWYTNKRINANEKEYLIGSLIESVSKVSNVAGVYSAFLKMWDPRAVKPMAFIPLECSETKAKYSNKIFMEDADGLINNISGDILYLDPPYTSTQYISQYHTLETIAKNDRPEVHGIGAHRDNGDQISPWSKYGRVHNEFVRLIMNAKFRYIMFSYSDAGLMSKEFIEKVLKRFAKPGTYTCKEINFVKYKSTRAVNREEATNTKNKAHFEWLFFIEKAEDIKYISPLNYIGGKWDVLDLLKAHYPKKIDTFYDLFGGGGTVSVNAPGKCVVYNDINWIVKNLLEFLTDTDPQYLCRSIDKKIKKYGLEKANKEAYMALRADYNSLPPLRRDPLDLYLLICFGFEHQIRFNSKLEFNNPCGNSGYSQDMLEKMMSFSVACYRKEMLFKSKNYDEYLDEIKKTDFVYCDPPYLKSCGAYNDGKRGFNGWDDKQDKSLMDFLDKLNSRGIRFMLSNMASRNNIENVNLRKWVKKNKYTVVFDKKITRRNRQDRREIIIINY